MVFQDFIEIDGKHGRPIMLDFRYQSSKKEKPVLIFAHGFKGFKDWGHFNLIADSFANAGFLVIKFNFSHNGGTSTQLIDFPDLEAFANNNFTIELDDLGCVIDWLFYTELFNDQKLNKEDLSLLGHSRGGAITILKANEDERVKKIVSWAAVSSMERWDDEILEKWKKEGVLYVVNGRTKQNMPMYFQLYDNYMANINRLDVARACSSMNKPHLIIHGNKDTSVKPEEANCIHQLNPQSKLIMIEEANHTFGGKHPYNEEALPEHTIQAINETIKFIK